MTTVAFDGESMSCDTMMTDGGIRLYIETKMIKNSEFVLGWAGSVGVARRVLAGVAESSLGDLLISGVKGQEDLESRLDILLVCRETKQIFVLVGNNFISIRAAHHAIGSGADVAIGAMMHGATSKQAVKTSSKVDLNTGGRVLTIKV